MDRLPTEKEKHLDLDLDRLALKTNGEMEGRLISERKDDTLALEKSSKN